MKVKVITLARTTELIQFTTRVICRDGKYGIDYLGDFYEIHPEKIFMEKNHFWSKWQPTLILNPFLYDIIHTLDIKQQVEKLLQES